MIVHAANALKALSTSSVPDAKGYHTPILYCDLQSKLYYAFDMDVGENLA